ncbi:MAG: hypothetical protein FK734_07675 [Asgard group archaeon]|nr:hypothetical protein [Asgard group archaeon]
MKKYYNLRIGIFIAIAFSAILYYILFGLSIHFYPGGARLDPSFEGFSFFKTFISDLGRNIAINGEPNDLSQALFQASIIVSNFFFLLFYFTYTTFFIQKPKIKWIAISGLIIGILSSSLYVALAFTPWDVNTNLHNKLIYSAAPIKFISGIFYFIATMTDKSLKRNIGYYFIPYILIYIVFAITTTATKDMASDIKWGVRIFGHFLIAILEVLIFALIAMLSAIYLHKLQKNENININQPKI